MPTTCAHARDAHVMPEREGCAGGSSSRSGAAQQQQEHDAARQAMLRRMDLFMYVLYSGDQVFVMNMVEQVTREVCTKYDCPELASVLVHKDKPLLFRTLFFLMLNFYKSFRHWALTAAVGLLPVCPHKATRFLLELKHDLVPRFLVDERMRLEDFERQLRVAYVAS